MDAKLKEALDLWETQIQAIKEIEGVYFELEASEKSLYSKLYNSSKEHTIKDKEASAYDHADWRQFSKGLALSKADYLHALRQLERCKKNYEAVYVSFKNDHDYLRKNS